MQNSKAICSSARTPPRRTRCRCCTRCTPRRPAPRSSSSIRASRAPRPRPTCTCASAPAPTSPFLYGVLYHMFKNGWEDKQYIHDRVYGMDKVREEVDEVDARTRSQDVTGVSEEDCYKIAETMAKNRPATIVWCMGQTQHTIGNAMVRAFCILQLALGNVGVTGGGANIFRGHDNVQGATDIGPNPDSLPGYYGIIPGAWAHWARVWNVDLAWLKKQYASEAMMTKPGITVSRWIDGVMEKNENDRPGFEHPRDVLLGPCAQQPDARPGDGQGDEKARPAGGDRPVSVGHRGDGDAAKVRRKGTAPCTCCRRRRSSRPRARHRVQPLAPVAREGDRAAVRSQARPDHHVPVREEARLRRPAASARRTASRTSRW